MTPATHLPTCTTAVERRYVPAADVAKACGLSEFALDTRFRPDDWASPRDFIFDGRSNRYAVLSLYGLADALQSAGQGDAAILLRAWITKIPEPKADEIGQLVKVAHVDADEAELDRLAGKFTRRHASDREARPHWTEGHDD